MRIITDHQWSAVRAEHRAQLLDVRAELDEMAHANALLAGRCADHADAAAAHAADAANLTARLGRALKACARYRAMLADCPHVDRVAVLQAANEAMDVPVGLDVTPEDWHAAVVCAIEAINAKNKAVGR